MSWSQVLYVGRGGKSVQLTLPDPPAPCRFCSLSLAEVGVVDYGNNMMDGHPPDCHVLCRHCQARGPVAGTTRDMDDFAALRHPDLSLREARLSEPFGEDYALHLAALAVERWSFGM